ncbi:MAG: coenzyme F420-0:L-glutamate ligase, partial [Gammaproteobacteria bacterium]|nr:coenzyme F420-0:L-glutamate ligase [Gammaproteobacteria bacterium]
MKLQFIGLENVPMIVPGDDLVSVIEQSLESMGEQLRADDVLVLAQ